jgi:hypothetical protein
MEKKPPQIFYVNGYGVPKNIHEDAGYVRYIQRVLVEAEIAGVPVVVYFAGGATDPAQPHKTEAGEMLLLAEELQRASCRDRVSFQTITEATDLLGNFRALGHRLTKGVDLTVFCEYARQDRVHFLVRRMFPGATVNPIPFDEGMGNPLLARLRQLPNTALMVGGWISPWFKHRVTDPLRQRHIRRDSARRHARPST